MRRVKNAMFGLSSSTEKDLRNAEIAEQSLMPKFEYKGNTYLFPRSWSFQRIVEYILVRYSGEYHEDKTLCIGGPKNATWTICDSPKLMVPSTKNHPYYGESRKFAKGLVIEYELKEFWLHECNFYLYALDGIDPLQILLEV